MKPDISKLEADQLPSEQLPRVTVALPVPLRRQFDYLWHDAQHPPQLGHRVRVSFGNARHIGWVVEVQTSAVEPTPYRLKTIDAVLDAQPLLNAALLELCQWASEYYHHPLGEVLLAALPKAFYEGKAAVIDQPLFWRALTQRVTQRAPKQQAVLDLLQGHPQGVAESVLKSNGFAPALLKTMAQKGHIESFSPAAREMTVGMAPGSLCLETPLPLTDEQQEAFAAVVDNLETFHAYLLYGVTGSGKTEVYLQWIERVLALGKQALVLVPEIGLTPQTLARFQHRFAVEIAVWHSGLTDKERWQIWLRASQGEIPIIIGTRSALFSPLPHLGLIILDEEHDLSFKQQEGFRYSARDLALKRAQFADIPIVLGSATPALETYHNAQIGRYRCLEMKTRAARSTALPSIELIDMRGAKSKFGFLSPTLLEAMKTQLDAQQQVLIFLNRRGYAPTFMCHQCGWFAVCSSCDARLVYHATDRRLHCHQCTRQRGLYSRCPECRSGEVHPVGSGTQRLEAALKEIFPAAALVRIDRDSTSRKGALESRLALIQTGEAQILLGTQMLAKGHHFPNVTLVGLLDIDRSFLSSDFKAVERGAQLLIQVAGRAGRGQKKGQVLIQTHHPEQPLLQCLIQQDYTAFATRVLAERAEASWPPYSFLALMRAESRQPEKPLALLLKVAAWVREHLPEALALLGPIPAPMEKKADRYRAQLLFRSERRAQRHFGLSQLIPEIDRFPEAKGIQWSIDVDPQLII